MCPRRSNSRPNHRSRSSSYVGRARLGCHATDLGRRDREIPRLWHIRGVGPVYAKKLVRAFGEQVFETTESTPDRLREIDGIGPVRAASVLSAWAEQKAVREIMIFLHSHSVSTARAVRIFKTYGSDAIQVMTENPYRLARDIRVGSASKLPMRLP